MFLIKLFAVELVATLLGALTTLHTDLKTLRPEDAYMVEGIRIGDYEIHKSPTATHRDSAEEYCKLKGQSLMYVQPAFDLPRIFKEMEVNKAWVNVAKANSRTDWKDPLGQKLYLKTSAEGFSVQQATDMLNNANELSTTEEGITKGVILSKETASKFVYKEIDKEGDVTAICFKPLSFPYREDDLRQMGKWRDHFVQTVNDTMSFVTEQQDMIKSYHTFFPGYNGTIPNDAKENMIDLQEKLESQVTECTARLGEIKGGLITIFRGIDLSIVEVSFFEKINRVLWIIGKIMGFFNNPQSIFPETLQSTLSTKIDHTVPLTRLIINESMYMMMVGKNETSVAPRLNNVWAS